MAAVQSEVFKFLFLISVSVEINGIQEGDRGQRYSSLSNHHVIVMDNSERHRREVPIVSDPRPSQNTTTSAPLDTAINDTHDYYTSTIMQNQADNYWVELSNATVHQELSNASMKAQTIQFQNSSFIFYGHEIHNVTITTGGFLYMSPFVHTFLTATQYTAPLMANFRTTGNNSDIYFKEYADQFIVEWRNVYLADQMEVGPFKFQTILYKNGSIAFIYQKVPLAISSISSSTHPVKIGLSDAFYIDTNNGRGQIIRRIYNYHAIKVNFTVVKPKTVIIFNQLPSCNLAKDCYSCLTQKTSFKCQWCAKVQRCSDSFDWYRQEWFDSGCYRESYNSTDFCNGTTSKPTSNAATSTRPSTTLTQGSNNETLSIKTQSTPMSFSTITSTPKRSTSSLAMNQTNNTASPNPTPPLIISTNTTPEATTLRELPTNTTTHQTTTLKKETSQMTSTKSALNSTKITTLNSNITYETRMPDPTSHPSTTNQATSTTTLLKKLTTILTTNQSSTLMRETSQMIPTHTTTVPCNKTKDGICAQWSQPSTQNQVSIASGSSSATMIAMIVVLGLILLASLFGFFFYAYRNPTSVPGQWLIQNRPSKLREKIKNFRDIVFKNTSDSSEKYRLETESEL